MKPLEDLSKGVSRFISSSFVKNRLYEGKKLNWKIS